MEKVFTNFRINKDIDRTGVNALMKQIRIKTQLFSDIIFNASSANGQHFQENWIITKTKKGYSYECLDRRATMFKTTVLNALVYLDVVIVVLICDMNQKINGRDSIKEMWGFKVYFKNNKTVCEGITSKEIYTHSTTNINGKSIPPSKEIVYCGPDGKICGWDID